MKYSALNRILRASVLVIFIGHLNAQISIPDIGVVVENVKIKSAMVEKHKIIEDSISVLEFSQILDNDLLFAFIHLDKSSHVQGLDRIIRIEKESYDKMVEKPFSNMYLNEIDSVVNIQIVESNLPNKLIKSRKTPRLLVISSCPRKGNSCTPQK